jgi:dihydroorotase
VYINPNGNEIIMRVWATFHAHLRQEELRKFLVGIFIQYGYRGIVAAEPNTKPPLLTGAEAIRYRDENKRLALGHPHGEVFEPIAIMQITERTTSRMVREAYAFGVRIFKVYPYFVTTNSENGVKDYTKIYPALGALEGLPGVVVQFHAETPRFEVPGRLKEMRFLSGKKAEMAEIEPRFPGLAMTIEHISSKFGVEWVQSFPLERRIGASIAIQYLTNTADDVLGYSQRSGGLVRVHETFKPHAKDPEDRDAVIAAALSGDPRFWSSNDDAWHVKGSKECAGASCGLANTIAAPSLTIEFFEKHNALDFSEPFTSEFGPRFYGHPLSTGTIRFIRKRWRVPPELKVPGTNDTVIPWRAGEEREWQIADDD